MSDIRTNSAYPDSHVDLLKLKMLTQVQEELTTWAKRRFWILVTATAVLGTFGITTLMTNIIEGAVSKTVSTSVDRERENIARATQLQLDILNRAIDQSNGKLSESIGKANQKMIELDAAIRSVEEQGAQARQLSTDVATQLGGLRVGLERAKAEADELSQRAKKRQASYGKMVFGEMNNVNDKIELLREDADYQNRISKLLQDLLIKVVASPNDARVRALLADFKVKSQIELSAHLDFVRRFNENQNHRVIIYVQREDAASGESDATSIGTDAEELARTLRTAGFQAEVWRPNASTTVDSLKADLTNEFGGIEYVLGQYNAALVSSAESEQEALQVKQAMASFARFKEVPVVIRSLQPAGTHLEPIGTQTVKPESVLLLYFAFG